jgi:hypothetical protein
MTGSDTPNPAIVITSSASAPDDQANADTAR